MTFLTFLKLQFRELEELWKQAPDTWAFVASWSLERLFHFGLDTAFNVVKAAFWPIQWLRDYGSEAWLLMALAWLLYRAALVMLRPWLPEREPQNQALREVAPSVESLDIEDLHGDIDASVQEIKREVDASVQEINREVDALHKDLPHLTDAPLISVEVSTKANSAETLDVGK